MLEKVCQSLRKATPIAIRQWLAIIDQYEINTSILQYKIKNILKKADSKPYYNFVLPDSSYIPLFIPLDTSLIQEISFTSFIYLPQVIPRLRILSTLNPQSQKSSNELIMDSTSSPTKEEEYEQEEAVTEKFAETIPVIKKDIQNNEIKGVELSQTEISGEPQKIEIIKQDFWGQKKDDKNAIESKNLEDLNKRKQEEFTKLQNLHNILTNIKEQDLYKINEALTKLDTLFSPNLLVEIYENREKIKILLESSIRLINISLKEDIFDIKMLDRFVILKKQIEQKKNKVVNMINSIKGQIETLRKVRIKIIELWNEILSNYKKIHLNHQILSQSNITQIKHIAYDLKGIGFLIKNDKCFNKDLLKKLENIDNILKKNLKP